MLLSRLATFWPILDAARTWSSPAVWLPQRNEHNLIPDGYTDCQRVSGSDRPPCSKLARYREPRALHAQILRRTNRMEVGRWSKY